MAKLLAHLPECLTINGKRYYRYKGDKTPDEVVAECKEAKAKFRHVEVLHPRLRKRDNLHDKPYQPTQHIYTTLPQTN